MVLLAVALAALMWERLENVPYSLRAIPIGVLVLSILFAVYAYGRRREVSELKGLLRGLQEHVGAAPSEEQLDQLSQVIMRSQRNFKELIDSFDDPACAVSLDGTLRTVNKRVDRTDRTAVLRTGGPQDLRLDRRTDPRRRGTRSGTISGEEALGGNGAPAPEEQHAASLFRLRAEWNRQGDEVVGASILGRDVTEQREKELRFTELFETLQEGVYFSTPDGQLLDANPALVEHAGLCGEERTAVG